MFFYFLARVQPSSDCLYDMMLYVQWTGFPSEKVFLLYTPCVVRGSNIYTSLLFWAALDVPFIITLEHYARLQVTF